MLCSMGVRDMSILISQFKAGILSLITALTFITTIKKIRRETLTTYKGAFHCLSSSSAVYAQSAPGAHWVVYE